MRRKRYSTTASRSASLGVMETRLVSCHASDAGYCFRCACADTLKIIVDGRVISEVSRRCCLVRNSIFTPVSDVPRFVIGIQPSTLGRLQRSSVPLVWQQTHQTTGFFTATDVRLQAPSSRFVSSMQMVKRPCRELLRACIENQIVSD